MEVGFYPPFALLSLAEGIHENTPTTKAARVCLDGIGILAIATSTILFTAVEVPLLTSGILIIVITEVAYFFLEVLGLIATDMSDHIFEEGPYRRSSISYKDHIPIMTIDADNDYEAGFDHGYLVAPYLSQIISRIRLLSFFVGYVQPSMIGDRLQQIKAALPQAVRDELRGVIAGVNEWDRIHSWCTPFPISEDELLCYQLIPDLIHFFLPHIIQWGCSAVANICPRTGAIHVGRHLDWPSLGVFGQFSLLIHKKNAGYISFAMPGFLGVLTGVTKSGQFIAMNVSPPRRIIANPTQGIPSIFFCRKIAEEGANPEDLTPLSPFHLILANESTARSYHFRQGRNGDETIVRRLDSRTPLITLNHIHYSETDLNADMFFGVERHSNIHYQITHRNAPVKHAMQSPFVNNPLTLHSIFIDMQTLQLQYNHSNGFSSSFPLRRLNLREIFA